MKKIVLLTILLILAQWSAGCGPAKWISGWEGRTVHTGKTITIGPPRNEVVQAKDTEGNVTAEVILTGNASYGR